MALVILNISTDLFERIRKYGFHGKYDDELETINAFCEGKILPDDAHLVNSKELIDIVEYMCDEDGDKEAQKWKNWFIRVINAQVNRENKNGK